MKFSIKAYFSKCKKLQLHLLEQSLTENFIICPVYIVS